MCLIFNYVLDLFWLAFALQHDLVIFSISWMNVLVSSIHVTLYLHWKGWKDERAWNKEPYVSNASFQHVSLILRMLTINISKCNPLSCSLKYHTVGAADGVQVVFHHHLWARWETMEEPWQSLKTELTQGEQTHPLPPVYSVSYYFVLRCRHTSLTATHYTI